MDKAFAERPTLRAWLEEYAAIEREFVAAMAAEGPVFAPRAAGRPRADELRETLRERGARFMNGEASGRLRKPYVLYRPALQSRLLLLFQPQSGRLRRALHP